MTMRPAPRYDGIVYAAVVAVIAIAAMVGATWAQRLSTASLLPARAPKATLEDVETTRIERATEGLRQAARFERTQRAGREAGSELIFPLHVPSAAQAPAVESRPIDPSTFNVVIVESGRERKATIDGLPVRVGERTAGGAIVRSIDRTGVVVEDSTGVRRGIDLRDMFVRQGAASVPSPLRTTRSDTEK